MTSVYNRPTVTRKNVIAQPCGNCPIQMFVNNTVMRIKLFVNAIDIIIFFNDMFFHAKQRKY